MSSQLGHIELSFFFSFRHLFQNIVSKNTWEPHVLISHIRQRVNKHWSGFNCFTCKSQGKKLFYRPQRSCGQGYVFTRVCDSVNREGVCLSACWDATPLSRHPPEQTPPTSRQPPPLGADTPRDQPPTPLGPAPPPPHGSRLRHTVNERPVHILLECILVITRVHTVAAKHDVQCVLISISLFTKLYEQSEDL